MGQFTRAFGGKLEDAGLIQQPQRRSKLQLFRRFLGNEVSTQVNKIRLLVSCWRKDATCHYGV
ncbi:hypothetical protein OW491_16740 [Neptunomonas sp. CHC150]|uniref:hypothetical protein n=1 Tax=Neptunomonas sp. CHC150 TaxID=2998324 RepID=UPI0025B09AA1|nr:hypothetical protein [Neptunomonas sp. CHC150]MDN2661461.1 hypothetical protein [Neptunomonas sp. CHC150]